MARDDRFYAFIIAHTPSSSSKIRRFCVEKRSLKTACFPGSHADLWLRFTAFMASLNKPHTSVPRLKINACARKTSGNARSLTI